jgi:3-oxoacyl-[acyl-carrier-protein] synthase II
MEFKLRGPNVTVSHKEASSLAAIVAAVDLLRAGRVANLIAGGVDAVYETFFKAYDRFKVMSAEPAFSRRVAPFDVERSGFVLGEGGFGLLLETVGAGVSTHGRFPCRSVRRRRAAQRLARQAGPLQRTMTLALEMPIDGGGRRRRYASATTRVLDATESALSALFSESRTVVTSVKGALENPAFRARHRVRQPSVGAPGGFRRLQVSRSGSCCCNEVATTAVAAPGRSLVNSFASGGALFSGARVES